MEGNRRLHRFLKLAAFGVAAVAIVGFVVMGLWNWLMPDLFGLRAIGFWQALGLLLLGKLLFCGLGGGSGRLSWRRRMRDRLERMTPEERERFFAGLRGLGATERGE